MLRSATLDLREAVVQRFDERRAAAAVLEEVVLKVGVACHHPHVAERFVEHARRTPGATLRAQAKQRLPGLFAEQADHHLAVGERRVVVGDLAQPPAGVGACNLPGGDRFHECMGARRA
jgi:hypothetical protein